MTDQVLTDEQVKYCSNVFGQITAEQGLVLAELASQVPLKHEIIEVGSYLGKSTCFLACGSSAGNSPTVHAFDLWTEAPWPEYAKPENFGRFCDNVAASGAASVVISHPGRFVDRFAMHIENGGAKRCGLAFIDADHTYAGVASDIKLLTENIMACDGVMVFHDAETDDWGVWRAITELLLRPGIAFCRFREKLAIVHLIPGAGGHS